MAKRLGALVERAAVPLVRIRPGRRCVRVVSARRPRVAHSAPRQGGAPHSPHAVAVVVDEHPCASRDGAHGDRRERARLRSRAIVPVVSWVPPGWAERLARPDGLLRPDRRAAFSFAVRPGDPLQLDSANVGQLIPRPAFLISRAEYRQLFQMLRERGLVGFCDPRTLPKHPMTGLVVDIQ